MKKNISILIILVLALNACKNEGQGHETANDRVPQEKYEENKIHLTEQQFNALKMKVDIMPERNLNNYIQTNGHITLPPQSEATVTAIIGATVMSVEVIEGDKVNKGQVLAYVAHPNLIRMQTEYVSGLNQLNYLAQELERQKTLYTEKVGAGADFQKTQADHNVLKANLNGLAKQLNMLGMDSEQIANDKLYEKVPIVAPLEGYIRTVNVRLGQYVGPQLELFQVVNNNHIHAHFLVYEQDIPSVKKGQKVRFMVESQPEKEYEAEIISVGKVIEGEPKAVSLHAEIDNEEGYLLSGMYARGRIIVSDEKTLALPEDAVIREGDRKYIFSVEQQQHDGEIQWMFVPHEVVTGIASDGWLEVRPLKELAPDMKFAWNNSYYLLAEWKKGESEHGH